MVEATVISLRIGDDEFIGSLIAGDNLYTGLTDQAWIHHRHKLEQQAGLLLEQLWRFALNCRLEFVRV